MAKRIVDEEMRFSIVVNGNKAQKELYDLEKSTRKYTEANKTLRAERTKLGAQGKRNSAEYKKLSSAIKANEATLRSNKARMSELQEEIGITGLTMSQLRKKASQLRIALNNMVPGSKQYNAYQNELKEIDARLKTLRAGARQTKRSLSTLADGFNRYQALAFSFIASATGIVLSLQKMIDYNGKLSDAQSDVMKTTGMTKDEVDELTKSFGMLETRTSRINLLKIAEEGGRIGIVKEEIADFVVIMDKAAVALGDSFPGGVEEVANKLGKLKFLFEETKDIGVDIAYNAIGSAINQLGAEGVASEINIANFATRVGSLPAALKPSIGDALALGAAFEESGIQSEIAGRAYNIFLKQASTNSSKFAQVMGLTTQEVEDLINTNPLDFFLTFSEGLKGMDATEIAKTLDFLGVNADGANKAIGAAGNNIDRFRELMGISNKSLVEGTSLLEEFNVKNNNLAATLEKVEKKLMASFSSERIAQGLNSAIQWIAKFIGATEDADGSVTIWRNRLIELLKILTLVIATIVSYRVGVKLATLWTTRMGAALTYNNIVLRINYALLIAQEIATKALALAKALLTLNLVRARVAWIALTTAMSMNPFGALLAILGAVIAAFVLYSDEVEKAATKQQLLNDAEIEAERQIKKQVTSLDTLLRVARDETASKEARLKAIKEINKISPKYLGNINLENINTLKAKSAIDEYVKSLEKQAMAKAFADKITELSKKKIDAESAELTDQVTIWSSLWNGIKNVTRAKEDEMSSYDLAVQKRKENVDAIQSEIDKIKELQSEFLKANPDQIGNNGDGGDGGGGYNVPDSPDETNTQKKSADELLKLTRETEDARIALIQDSFKRELEGQRVAHERKMADLRKQLVEESELKKLQTAIDNATLSGDDQRVAILTKTKEQWLEKNRQLNQQMEYEDEMHELKTGTIIEKGLADRFQKDQVQYERERVLREIKYNEELRALGDNEKAKEELTKEYQERELELRQQQLQKIIAMYDILLNGGEVAGFDLSLLTPEQVAEFEAMADQMRLKLSELGVDLDKLRNGGSDSDGPNGLGEAGKMDIFGMSIDDWILTFENIDTLQGKIEAAGAVVQGLTNMWQTYAKFQADSNRRELRDFEMMQDRKRRKLEEQLDKGTISQTEYQKKVRAMEDEYAKKKAEMEYEQAKRQKKIAMAQAIANTALAVINGLMTQPFFPLGIAMGALAGVMGGIQIAAVANQPLPSKGFETGYYGTRPIQREQDGKVFNAAYGGKAKTQLVDKPTHFLAGEGGKDFPEMIIDGRSFRQFTPEFKNSLYREIARVRGFESGYYPTQTPAPEFQETNQVSTATALLISTLERNNELLQVLKDEGIIAIVSNRDTRSMKRLKEGLQEYEELRNKNKI